MKKYVILFVAPRYHTNQVGIVRALLNHGHDVHFHVRTKGFTEDYSLVEPKLFPESWFSLIIKRLFGYGGSNNKRYMPSLIIYWKTLKKLNPNIVIIRKHGFLFTYLAAFYAMILNSRVIFYGQINTQIFETFRQRTILNKIRKFKFFFPLIVYKADFITPLLSKNHKSSSLPRHCYFLPFSVEVKKRNDIENSKIVKFLTIGKFVPRKNYILLINCAFDLAKIYDFTITIIGEVSTKKHLDYLNLIKNKIKLKGLENRIILKHNIKYSDMNNIYKNHHVFILPASNEPAAISPLEAMGFGMPVICTDTCGTKTYIQNGFNGFIVNTNSKQSFKDKMEFFIKDFSSVFSMSNNAHNYAKNGLSDTNYYTIFQNIINNK